MRAIAVTEFGGPEKLALIEVPVPKPASREALVKLEYAGVNFIDIYMRSGEYARSQTYQTPLPMVIGMEGMGTVTALGDEAKGLAVGPTPNTRRSRPGSWCRCPRTCPRRSPSA
jgi:NADPH2:quinone reductase